jgi:TrmH family RNA methyltransferase
VIRDITGRQNHSVKLARKLQSKKHRRERGLLVGEGVDLLRAAAEAGADVRDILVRRDLLSTLPAELLCSAAQTDASVARGPHIGVCDEDTLAYASSLGGSADVLFMSAQPTWNLGDIDLAKGLTLFLDGVGDPGNVGTLVRSCAAFAASGIVCSPGTADPYSPKALRAGMGAQFTVRIVTDVTPADLRAKLSRMSDPEARESVVLVADARRGKEVSDMHLEAGAILVLGAEREGPGEAWAGERRVTISQKAFDSLNVAMAGTVLLYELTRHSSGREQS